MKIKIEDQKLRKKTKIQNNKKFKLYIKLSFNLII